MNGQGKFDFLLSSCEKNGRLFPHLLVLTQDISILNELARKIAVRLDVNRFVLDFDSASIGDICGLLTNLKESDILLVPHLHTMGKRNFQYLSKAMTDFIVDIDVDAGPNMRAIQVKLNKFTVLASAHVAQINHSLSHK